MMKDEAGGNIILEFVGLRAKCYATKVLGGEEKREQKGFQKELLKQIYILEL